jgi:hypothetical protein
MIVAIAFVDILRVRCQVSAHKAEARPKPNPSPQAQVRRVLWSDIGLLWRALCVGANLILEKPICIRIPKAPVSERRWGLVAQS